MPDEIEKKDTAPAAAEEKSTIKELEYDGYKFTVDADLIDDIEAFELIHLLENEGRISAVVPLLKYLIGKDGYDQMKAHFIKKNGRFRASELQQVYLIIVGSLDPKDLPTTK